MNKTSKLLAVTAAALLIPAALFAGLRRGAQVPAAPGDVAKRVVERLDLTPQQVDQIRTILVSHKAELTAELARIKEARSHQFEAIHAATFDEAAIRAAGRAVGQAETELAVTRGRIVSEIRPVLTPEQQAEAKEMLADARAFVGSFLERLRERLQSDPLAGV
ncbi:MAG TPA: Spy/CpxP family protein refolding chaperone [Thermoanaerobaculia bacterium]|jgi:Spy/CpxP family protein refolding chaperone|nr:Spy/CpxP family protein refolding chaperone [Thermoanaerobaculia bacterium]